MCIILKRFPALGFRPHSSPIAPPHVSHSGPGFATGKRDRDQASCSNTAYPCSALLTERGTAMKNLMILLAVALMVGFAVNASAIGCSSEIWSTGWDSDTSSSAYFNGTVLVGLSVNFYSGCTGNGYAQVNRDGDDYTYWRVTGTFGSNGYPTGMLQSLNDEVVCMTYISANGHASSTAYVQWP